jgi:predicted nucleotide-binding protein
MELEQVKRILDEAGLVVTQEKRLPNDTGTQLCLKNGAKVNLFDKGTYNVQGRNADSVKRVLEQEPTPKASPTRKQPVTRTNNKVFVVYGHDQSARNQLEAMLRRWGLEPLILDQLRSEGQTVIEKLEGYTDEVNFGVVLAMPDDEGHRAARQDEKAYRARQNVVLELGMLLSKLGRRRVAILLKQ